MCSHVLVKYEHIYDFYKRATSFVLKSRFVEFDVHLKHLNLNIKYIMA